MDDLIDIRRLFYFVAVAEERSNQNIDPHKISEMLLHVALYAGIPAANSAFATAKKVFAQDEGDSETNRQEEKA